MSGSFHICDIRVQLGGCGIYGYKKKKKKISLLTVEWERTRNFPDLIERELLQTVKSD